MNENDQKHIAQEIVDKVFLELHHFEESAEKTITSKERDKIERRRKQLLKELDILLGRKNKPWAK